MLDRHSYRKQIKFYMNLHDLLHNHCPPVTIIGLYSLSISQRANREQSKVVVGHRTAVSLTDIVPFWNLSLFPSFSLLG